MNGCTIGNRVLVHLSCYSRYREEYVCPPEVTQDGIATRLGISRAHVALELKRLKQRNQVEHRLAHVARAKSRRKVYHLTQAGFAQANELKDAAKRKVVRLLDGNGGQECTGQDALKILCSLGVGESEALIKILTAEAVPITAGHVGGKRSPDASGLAGREQELDKLSRWFRSPGKAVCVMTGAAGAGKSSLAGALFSMHEEASIWQHVSHFQSIRSLLNEVALKLEARGRSKLRMLLSREDFDPREAIIVLAEEMGGGLLILDDLHNSNELEDFSALFLSLNDWPIKVLLVSRVRPSFCQRWSDTFQRPYEEVSIMGLSLECARKLLTMHANMTTDDGLIAAHESTEGRPLDMVLLAEFGWPFAGSNIPDLRGLLEARMSEEEMAFLRLAAMLHTPFDPACLDLTPAQSALLSKKSLFLENSGGYLIHERVRDLVVEGLGTEERRLLHARVGTLEELMGNRVDAASHYVDAGLRERAVGALSSVDTLQLRRSSSKILHVLRAIGDESRLDILRGRTSEVLGRFEEARLCYERAVAGSGAQPNVEHLLLLGNLELKMSLAMEAERHFSMAAVATGENGYATRRARALSGLAHVSKEMGDYEKAISRFDEAGRLFENAGDLGEVATCLTSSGETRLDLGNHARAVADLMAALKACGMRDAKTAAILNMLGAAYKGLGDELRAIENLLGAVNAADYYGQSRIAACAMAGAAEACLRVGRKDEASELCRKALRLGEKLDDPCLLSTVHATLGELNKELGHWKRAESHILTSIQLLKPLNQPRLLARRYEDLASLYETTGDKRKARLWGSRSRKMVEWEGSRQEQPNLFSKASPRFEISKSVQQF